MKRLLLALPFRILDLLAGIGPVTFEVEREDIEPQWPRRRYAAEPIELDALFIASALHHEVPVFEVGVPVPFGVGGEDEARATERLAVDMLSSWGHFE